MMVREKKGGAMDALRAVNKMREKNRIQKVEKSTIYRFLRGETHRRGQKEIRGSKKILEKKDIDKLDKVRKRLLKRVDSTRRVTYQGIHKEAGLEDKCCERLVQDALRSRGVRFRTPRRKVCLSDEDAKARLAVAKDWVKRPEDLWVDNVHAYVDNKTWPLPLTPKQKERYNKSRVTGHLRKAEEGVARGCTRPRDKHFFLGMPSVTISAAVAKDKVIMWHVLETSWNGTAAAKMYSGPLATALQKTWGKKKRYTIVEDGDRKGNQSGLGMKAKQSAKIRAMTLPPRTPSWMPLDYAVWREIDDQMVDTAPAGRETREAFLARLEKCAKSLPRGYIRKVIARTKGNVQGTIDARGYHAKSE